jgi:hypothetical protein
VNSLEKLGADMAHYPFLKKNLWSSTQFPVLPDFPEYTLTADIAHGPRSTRCPAGFDADIGIVACIPLRVLTKLLFAVTGAEEIYPVSELCPEVCRILIDYCKTDWIRCHVLKHSFLMNDISSVAGKKVWEAGMECAYGLEEIVVPGVSWLPGFSESKKWPKKRRSGPVACIVLGDLLRRQGAVVEGERADITLVIEVRT